MLNASALFNYKRFKFGEAVTAITLKVTAAIALRF
jgi:hypothetical protein